MISHYKASNITSYDCLILYQFPFLSIFVLFGSSPVWDDELLVYHFPSSFPKAIPAATKALSDFFEVFSAASEGELPTSPWVH